MMSDHDPLCPGAIGPIRITIDGTPFPCPCALIEQVRADERERIALAIEDKADDLPLDGYLPTGDLISAHEAARDDLHDAARIARAGGSDA